MITEEEEGDNDDEGGISFGSSDSSGQIPGRDRSESEENRQSEQANKIMKILESSTATEKLDFTNGLIAFADKIEMRNINALLPALVLLARDTVEIKKSLLNQFKGLI